MWVFISMALGCNGPPVDPDGETTVHHSELTPTRTVTAFNPKTVDPQRCRFWVHFDKEGLPTTLDQVSGPAECSDANAIPAKEALSQWRVEPFLYRGEPIRVRAMMAMWVDDSPPVLWEKKSP